MKFFVVHEGKVSTIEAEEASPVGCLKALLRDKFDLRDVDQGSGKSKTVVLSYNSTPLQDDWILSDVGVPSGSTLHFHVADEKTPSLRLFCAFSNETVQLFDSLDPSARVAQLKRVVVTRTGVPCSVFRLLFDDAQLFDCHDLSHYGISRGSTIRMETWDGWNAFLNATRKGQSKQVVENIVAESPETAEYQRRVALFTAAHFGHTDLAAAMLKMGAHPDRPVGEHPARRWCADRANRLFYAAPVHQAAANGHLPVLRLFVRHSDACVAARDGNGMTPLRLAALRGHLDCVAYLKQQRWRKGNENDISHSVFSKIRDWKESIKMKMAYEADVGGSCGGDGTVGIKTGRFKHRIRPPLVGSAIFIDGLHKGMQKSDNYVTRLDYRDFSDSDNEQSGISMFNAPTQLHHSWPSVGERGISDRKVSIREPLLPPLASVPNEVSIQSQGKSMSMHRLPQIRMVEKTKAAYENYRGKTCRENVLFCLDIGSAFSSKPWLSQLRVAMKVNSNAIRRPAAAVKSDSKKMAHK